MTGASQSLLAHDEQRDVLAVLLGAALTCLVVGWVLTPSAVFPMHHDDYAVLGASLRDMLSLVERPVSTCIAYVMGYFGPGFSYALLNLLMALVPGLVLSFVLRLLEVRGTVLAGAVFGIFVFGHASAIEHGRYLGLITNLTSHAFGVCAMLLLLSGWRRQARLPLAGATLAYALSAFAKEDFLLPPLLLIVYLVSEDRIRAKAGIVAEARQLPSWWTLPLAFAGLAIGSVAYNVAVRSPFLAGVGKAAASADPYALTLAPGALWHNFIRLTWESAHWQCLVWAVGTLLLVVLWPGRWRAWVLLVAITVAVILPYVPLGNNSPEYRAFAWLPWLCAPAIVAASLGWFERAWIPGRVVIGKLLAPATIAAALVVSDMDSAGRQNVAGWYASTQARNALMVQFIAAHKPAFDHDGIAGVAGVDGLSPWSKTSGRYLQRKFGLMNEWVVFVDEPNQFFPLGPGLPGSKIQVALTVTACDAPNMLVARFDAAGKGSLVRGRQICDEARANRGGS